MVTGTCPICERKIQGQTRDEWPDWPFCSSRCRLADLGRWLGEEYRIPGVSLPDDEEPPSPDDA